MRDAYGQNNIVRLNDNIALLEGIVEQMTSAGGWLSRIRSRVPMSRPLTKVNEIKARAELAYKSRILALERDLRESQERVQAIRNQMSSGSKDGLTAEQKAELKEYSFKNSQVRRELKEVRRQLRADMNRIDTILRVVNLLVVPGLVILAGLLWSFFRFSKWRRKNEQKILVSLAFLCFADCFRRLCAHGARALRKFFRRNPFGDSEVQSGGDCFGSD